MNIDGRERGGPPRQLGLYSIFHQIASGGMATIHLARFSGSAGFPRVVAVKHLHPHLSADPAFRAIFIDEARRVSRLRHPNVVPTLDVVVEGTEIFLVMEYISGEALSALCLAARHEQQDIPLAICSAILVGALRGLHAAHEARTESGEPLGIVHRDVSPPNIMVGVDGVSMMLDFGVARAMEGRPDTRPGLARGKSPSSSSSWAPEQLRGEPVTRATDIFAAAVVLWELLTTRRLFGGGTEHQRMNKVLQGGDLTPPSAVAARIPAGLDGVVMKGLRAIPAERYGTALEMAEAIERTIPPASQRVVGEWVARTGAEALRRRAELVEQVELADVSWSPPSPGSSGAASPGPTFPALPGESQGGLSLYIAEKAAPPIWRDRRAIATGAIAASILAGILVIARGAHLPPPTAASTGAASSAATADGARPAIGTTVIMKAEPLAPEEPVPLPAAPEAAAEAPPSPYAQPPAPSPQPATIEPVVPAPPPAISGEARTRARGTASTTQPARSRTLVRRRAAVARPVRTHPTGAPAAATDTPGDAIEPAAAAPPGSESQTP